MKGLLKDNCQRESPVSLGGGTGEAQKGTRGCLIVSPLAYRLDA